MTTPALPSDGSLNWGDPLNAYIVNVVMATLNSQVSNLNAHEANSPADPHGDRAFALNLMLPITQHVNKAGGFVQLDPATGLVPAALVPPYVPAAGSWSLLAGTPAGGYALQHGTPTLLSYTFPNDGNLHRAVVIANQTVSSVTTGGSVSVSWTAPDGTAGDWVALSQLNYTGWDDSVSPTPPLLVKAGTTITVRQSTALTAGAATVWAEIWGS